MAYLNLFAMAVSVAEAPAVAAAEATAAVVVAAAAAIFSAVAAVEEVVDENAYVGQLYTALSCFHKPCAPHLLFLPTVYTSSSSTAAVAVSPASLGNSWRRAPRWEFRGRTPRSSSRDSACLSLRWWRRSRSLQERSSLTAPQSTPHPHRPQRWIWRSLTWTCEVGFSCCSHDPLVF